MVIDVPTVLLLIGCITLFVAATLFREWYVRRGAAPELCWWGGAYLMFTAGAAIAPMRLDGWDVLGVGASNTFLITGNLMVWYGVHRFSGRPLTPAVFLFGPLWLFAYAATPILDHTTTRVVFISIFTAAVAFAIAFELGRIRHEASAARDLAMLYAGHGLFFLVRAVLEIVNYSPRAFVFQNWMFQIVLFEAAIFSVIVGTYLLTMTRERAFNRAQAASEIDFLTGIDNRRAFFRKGRELLDLPVGGPATMLVFDLDRFKQVNDVHGHAVGDEVLKLFCRAAERHVGSSDVFGRLGGEEFAILARSDDAASWERRAEEIRKAFQSSASIVDGLLVSATVSAGLASTNRHLHDIAPIFDAADRALYRAKQSGRNRVEWESAFVDPVSHRYVARRRVPRPVAAE